MKEELLNLLNECCPGVDFENEKALIDDGIIESLDLMSIVSEIMYTFDIELGVEDLMPENFNDFESILNMVESHK